MLNFIFAILLLAIALTTVVLRKTYAFVPARELKRQAASGNETARVLYRAVGYGASQRLLLWTMLALSSAGSLVLFVGIAPAWISFVVVAVALGLAFSWLPNTRVTSFGLRLARWLTPTIVWLLNYAHPLLDRLSGLLQRRYLPPHSGLFELTDVLDLLELQANQTDSRITSEELELIRRVLRFGDYHVRDILRPRDQIKSVAATDVVGPLLLDDLHASGQTSFPVKKTIRSKEIVGSLHIGDVGIHSTGVVSDHMTTGVAYVHESDSLADALHVFYQTKKQLFIVINSFEEYVGVLTLEDILHEIVGRPAADETLGSHEDSAAVAARYPRKKQHSPDVDDLVISNPGDDLISESDETVVE